MWRVAHKTACRLALFHVRLQRRWCGTDVSGSTADISITTGPWCRPFPLPPDFGEFLQKIADRLFDDEEGRKEVVKKLYRNMGEFFSNPENAPKDNTTTEKAPQDAITNQKAPNDEGATIEPQNAEGVAAAEEAVWKEVNSESFWGNEKGFLKILREEDYFLVGFENCKPLLVTRDVNNPPEARIEIGSKGYPLNKDVILDAVRAIRFGRTPVPKDNGYPFHGLLGDFMSRYISDGLDYIGVPASTAIDDLNRRTVTVVSGPSGSGKTTLCQHHLPMLWKARLVTYFIARDIRRYFEGHLGLIKESEEELQRAVAGWIYRHYSEYDPYFHWAVTILDTPPKGKGLFLRTTKPADILVNCIGTESDLPVEWKMWWNSLQPVPLEGTMVVIVDEIGPHLDLARALISSLKALYGNETVLKRVRRVELVLCGTGLELLEDQDDLGYITSDPRKASRVSVIGPNAAFLNAALKAVTPDYGKEMTPMFCHAIKHSALFQAIQKNARLLVLTCYYLQRPWSPRQDTERLDANMVHRIDVLRDNAIAHSLGIDGHVELALLEYPKHNGLSKIRNDGTTKQQIVDAALVELIERVVPIEETDEAEFLRRCLGPSVIVCGVNDQLLKKLGPSVEKYRGVWNRCKLYIEEPNENRRQTIKKKIEKLFVCLGCRTGILIMPPRYPVRTVVPVYKSPTHDEDLRKACQLGLLEYDSNEAPAAMTAVTTFAFGAPGLSLDGYALENFTARWAARLVALQRGEPPRLMNLLWQLPAKQHNGGPTLDEYDEVRNLLHEARAVVLVNGPSAPGPDVMVVELPPENAQNATKWPVNTAARITLISDKMTDPSMLQPCMDMGCMCLEKLRKLVMQRMADLVSKDLIPVFKRHIQGTTAADEPPQALSGGSTKDELVTTIVTVICETRSEQCAEALLSLLKERKNTDAPPPAPDELKKVHEIKKMGSLLKAVDTSGEYRRASLLTLALMCMNGELKGCDTLQDLDDRVAELCLNKKILVTACLVSGGDGNVWREKPELPGWEDCLLSWEQHPWVQCGGVRRCPAISFGPLESLVDVTARGKPQDRYLYFRKTR